MIAYLVTNTINGKQYVGISRHSTPGKRWQEHIAQSKRGPNGRLKPFLLHKAIIMYGQTAFTIEHVASALDWKSLCATEVSLIAQYRTFWFGGGGYNMTRGGDGVDAPRTPEWRAKISASNMGKRMSPEFCAKMSAARLGIPHDRGPKISAALKGRAKSEEHLARLRANHKGMTGRTMSSEHKAKVIAVNTGRIWINNGSQEQRVRRGDSLPVGWSIGRKQKYGAAVPGYRHSEEIREKMRGPRRKIIESDGQGNMRI